MPMGKTIEKLEGRTISEPPEGASALISHVYRLRKKLVGEFSVEDLRLMIGQNEGTQYLMPRALGLLEQNPLVEGYHYPGELLHAVMHLPDIYWQEHPDQLVRAVWAARKGLKELEGKKAKRSARLALLPGEDPNGSDPLEEKMITEIRLFLDSHENN